MEHLDITNELLERAALYALGSLDATEAGAFEEHLARGCDVCAEELHAFELTVVQLAASVSPLAPRQLVREKLFAKIGSGERVIRSDEGAWAPGSIEGLAVKRLTSESEPGRYIALVRLDAHGHYPAHWHNDAEEMFVLEGSLRIAGESLSKGDFYSAPAGNVHEILGGPEGCVCLLISPDLDEPLETAPTAGESHKLHVLRTNDGPWDAGFVPGMSQRILHVDPDRGTVTAMVRMDAGCQLLPHRHGSAEQLFIVEGDAVIEDERLQAGDFYRIDAGTVHEITRTVGGCTFLLLSSTPPIAA